jgi:sulfonate transport system substrate-binding protein
MTKSYSTLIILTVTLIVAVIVSTAGIGYLHNSHKITLAFAAEKEDTLRADSGATGVQVPTTATTSTAAVIRIGSTKPGQVSFGLLNTTGTLVSDFSASGVKTTFKTYKTDTDVINALSDGSIDVAYTTADPALTAAAAGADIRLIGLASYNPVSPTDIILSGKDKTTYLIKDLKGKKIAFQNGTENQASLYRALSKAGLKFSDIKQVDLPFADSYAKLKTGDIDAIVENDAIVNQLITFGETRKVSARLLTSGKTHPGWAQPTIITVSSTFAQSHPDYLKRLLAQDAATAIWADTNPQKAVKQIAVVTGQPELTIQKTYPLNKFFLSPAISQDALTSLKTEETFLNKTDQIDGVINWNSFVDTKYL